ncbi:hypothetical protein ACQ4PT_055444 [Festuca glaucescens]
MATFVFGIISVMGRSNSSTGSTTGGGRQLLRNGATVCSAGLPRTGAGGDLRRAAAAVPAGAKARDDPGLLFELPPPAGGCCLSVAILVVPTVRVVITFNKFVPLVKLDEFFTPMCSQWTCRRSRTTLTTSPYLETTPG